MTEQVNHPAHYGGKDNPYEAIKVIEAWTLGFCLGNAVKYISRAGKKYDDAYYLTDKLRLLREKEAKLEDLRKARWYIDREIQAVTKDIYVNHGTPE